MKKEKSCGAIIIKDGKILIVKQKSGHYGFPKGHVEDKETEIQTAIREVKEETGIDIEIISDKSYSEEYNPKPDVIKKVVYFIGKPLTTKEKPQEGEIEKILWVPIENVEQILTHKEIKKLWKKAKEANCLH